VLSADVEAGIAIEVAEAPGLARNDGPAATSTRHAPSSEPPRPTLQLDTGAETRLR